MATQMISVWELEAWSKPGHLLPQEYGKDIAEQLHSAGIPPEAFLGLSAIPDQAHVINLRMALEAGEYSARDFASFCHEQQLEADTNAMESACKFLEFARGRALAWIHIPSGSDPDLIKSIASHMRVRDHIIIDPETSEEIKF
ncbi:hypothetical protein [Dongia sp.]|uniref:hypothetical protein n=1 Tax=Dongia sp. TaxID=1977262 RepID=UPI0037511C8B